MKELLEELRALSIESKKRFDELRPPSRSNFEDFSLNGKVDAIEQAARANELGSFLVKLNDIIIKYGKYGS